MTKTVVTDELVVAFFRRYEAEWNAPPSLSKVAQHFGKGKSAIHARCRRLEREGLLVYVEELGRYRAVDA